MNTQSPTELSPEKLNRQCDPEALPFEDTNGLPDLEEVIGQPRALRALELGSGVPGHGFNTFILGQPGSGRTTLSREYLERRAVNLPAPSDWAYVNNFEDPRYPIVLELPSGDAPKLRSEIKDVIERCQVEIDRIFKSDEYKNEHDRLLTELKKDQEAEFMKLQVDGCYSADSFHQRVVERLEEFVELEDKKKYEQPDPPKSADQETNDQEENDDMVEDKGTTTSHLSAN